MFLSISGVIAKFNSLNESAAIPHPGPKCNGFCEFDAERFVWCGLGSGTGGPLKEGPTGFEGEAEGFTSFGDGVSGKGTGGRA